MRFLCPNCSQNLLSTPEQIGMNVRCPACNQNVTVPPPPAAGVQTPHGQAPGAYDPYQANAGPQWSDQANVPILISGGIGLVMPRNWRAVYLRAALLATCMFFFFSGAPFLSVAQMAAGLYTYPIFVSMLAIPILGEPGDRG